jgi:spectrin alpha
MNEIAMQLITLGQTEAAVKIQTQLEDLNKKWNDLQYITNEKQAAFERAHEVQRFHRDADETKEWIQEKDVALSIDDLGKDLRSVQALQRKHEGLERDLAALGDKINRLDDQANKLKHNHPESTEVIEEKQVGTYTNLLLFILLLYIVALNLEALSVMTLLFIR